MCERRVSGHRQSQTVPAHVQELQADQALKDARGERGQLITCERSFDQESPRNGYEDGGGGNHEGGGDEIDPSHPTHSSSKLSRPSKTPEGSSENWL